MPKYLKKKNRLKYLKLLVLLLRLPKEYKIILKKHLTEENIRQELKLKNIDKTRKSFIKEIKQNGLLSKKHKEDCKISNYIEQISIVASAVTECVSIYPFLLLL